MKIVHDDSEFYYAEQLKELKQLKVKVYRGLHIDSSASEENVDDFLRRQSASNEQWERLLNHCHIADFFAGIEDVSILQEYQKEVASAWMATLSAIDSKYQVEAYDSENGPSLTFYYKD